MREAFFSVDLFKHYIIFKDFTLKKTRFSGFFIFLKLLFSTRYDSPTIKCVAWNAIC